MRRSLSLFLWLLASVGCQSAPADTAVEAPGARATRATEMPESLRCRRAEDCVQKPTCYWETPTCIASTSAVQQKCGDDADPVNAEHPAVSCVCQEGQCTPR